MFLLYSSGNFDVGMLPSKLSLPLYVYLTTSWRDEGLTKQEASEVLEHVKGILRHRSLNTKFEIKETISDMNLNIKVNEDDLKDFGKRLPESNLKRGNIHMALVGYPRGYLGLGMGSSACMKDNR